MAGTGGGEQLTPARAFAPDMDGPGGRRVGGRLRFRGELSAAFPGSEISRGRVRRERHDDESRTELFVTNFSLLGVLGPMPDSFADWVRERLADRDSGMAEFLDIFNHRIGTLRYELKAASVTGFDASRPEESRYAREVGALMGLAAFEGEGERLLAQRVPMPKRALLALAGLVANGRKSASTAATVLRVYLGAPVRVEELRGAWRAIEPEDRTRLGERRLDEGAPLGRRVWVNHAAIGLAIGPLSYARLCLLLADRAGERDHLDERFGTGHAGLAAMLHYLFDRHVDVHVCVRVEEAGIPPSLLWRPRRLAGFGSGHGLRLGQTAWLRGRPAAPRQVRFTIAADGQEEAA
jgi:type VI secretion system protein ImpH